MILFTEWYIDPDARRQAELLECLRLNCANGAIKEICLFGTAEHLHASDAALRALPGSEKISPVPLYKRPTFAQLFAQADDNKGQIVAIANTDIFFDGTIERLREIDFAENVLALTRWDVTGPDGGRFSNNAAGQDAWIFRAPLRVDDAGFTPGILACDKRLAALLAERRTVINPSLSIRVWHLHVSGVRRDSVNLLKRVAPPYAVVPITELPAPPS